MKFRVLSLQTPRNAIHLPPKGLRSRLRFMDLPASLHRSAFHLGKRLSSELLYSQVMRRARIERSKRMLWSIRSNVDNNPISNNQGTTRLIKAIQNLQLQINTRIQQLRRDLPMKFLFLLIGYYCATAFSTVIGQTGDWDILSAALAVVIVEGVGALMYRLALPSFSRFGRMLTLLNYWKAGLKLGLFMDSFKY